MSGTPGHRSDARTAADREAATGTNGDDAPPPWDLSGLYEGAADPRIETDLATAAHRAQAFAQRWRGAVAPGTLSAAELASALSEWEGIQIIGRRPGFYASLLFAADTQDEAAQRLLEHTQERWAAVETDLVFFTVELTRLPDDAHAHLCEAPELADARHFLEHLRRERPHVLGEAEERVITRKNLAGREAFVRLFEELTGSFRFTLDVDGAEQVLTGEEVLALLSHPDRELRARAYAVYLARFAEHGLVLTGIFNSLLLDHRIECELRRYTDLAEPTHHDNRVSASTVEALMAATEAHYGVARSYFDIKARLLGLPALAITDLYAPLPASPRHVPYPAARDLVLDAFATFSPAFRDHAAAFFHRRWIDAAVRPGKTAGASCSAYAPAANPFIVASYTGSIRDVTTLAHELGHGVHDQLAARQRYLNYTPPLTLAETASVFAEMILVRHLLAAGRDPAEHRALLCLTLEEIIATVFRQNVLTRFELAAHERRRSGQLTAHALGELWWQANAALYGDRVEMPPAYRWGWSYIPHFVHSRFYCYAYVFGELLALALYERYRQDGPAFVPRYLELLAAGGCERPATLLARLGCDIEDPAFWNGGFRVIEGLIAELDAAAPGRS
jgi:oligoendopeptidase F